MNLLILSSLHLFNYFALFLRQFTSEDVHGDIRLSGGESSSEGNVEIFHSNSWGFICDDDWDREEGDVVCRQLGFERAERVSKNSEFGLANHFWLDNLGCDGHEKSLLNCRTQTCNGKTIEHCYRVWGHNNCLISEAAGVVCLSNSSVSHAHHDNVTIEEAVKNSRHKNLSHVIGSNSIKIVSEKRAKLKNNSNTLSQLLSYRSQIVTSNSSINSTVPGSVERIVSSASNLTANNSAQYPGRFSPLYTYAYDVSTLPSRRTTPFTQPSSNYNIIVPLDSMQIRLVGGSFRSGMVEFRLGEQAWQSICGDGWSTNEASVICRMLSMGQAVEATQGTTYGRGRPHGLSGVTCTGSELHLRSCQSHSLDRTHCPGYESYAGVVCGTYLPDLVTDYEEITKTIHIDIISMAHLTCAMEENCLSSSAYSLVQSNPNWYSLERHLLRFTVAIANIGSADFVPIIPKSYWDWHECHQHYHSFEVFSSYNIRDLYGNRVAEGHKASFCLEDGQCRSGSYPKYECVGFGDQGISPGCIDVYNYDVDCQWVDMTDVPAGRYTLEVIVNPNRQVPEERFDNNRVICDIYYNVYSVETTGCRIQ